MLTETTGNRLILSEMLGLIWAIFGEGDDGWCVYLDHLEMGRSGLMMRGRGGEAQKKKTSRFQISRG